MNKFVCIHGHFYQPPRENPWLEEVEIQSSAHPYHDWNERITAECYAPNSLSRLLGGDGIITDIINNYAHISFNFGPTLLSWMENHEPELYRAIIESDRLSQERYSGHGSAIAQIYNHMIMPLANRRDKETQVNWGIIDFALRFGRQPEGMWLPETAVDLETLDLLAKHGIRFAILAPNQAKRIKPPDDDEWIDVEGGRIDPRRPYRCRLPSDKSIDLFFYDGSVAHDAAFGDLLRDGERFAERLVSTLDMDNDKPQIAHIATDGETYGHHHQHGDMALAHCLRNLESRDDIRLTVYGEYLDNNPPEYEVEIHENSSWSCVHGVERWRNDCGCKIGAHPHWTQSWRAPLRNAMNWLNDNLAELYEQQGPELLKDPWKARDKYIDVILDRSQYKMSDFMSAHEARELEPDEEVRVWKLLEMERHSLLMFTSCGWFFDEISGIETVQVIKYANRAMQLARETTGLDFEPAFIKILSLAPSNIGFLENGGKVYEKYVQPARVDLERVAAHYSAVCLMNPDRKPENVYCYEVEAGDVEHSVSGNHVICYGRLGIKSKITLAEEDIYFTAFRFGEHDIVVGATNITEISSPDKVGAKFKETFESGDASQVILLIEKYYGDKRYSLRHLMQDEKQRIFNQLTRKSLEEINIVYHQQFDHNLSLVQSLIDAGIPLPTVLKTTIDFVCNMDMKEILENEILDIDKFHSVIKRIDDFNASIDKAELGYSAGRRVVAMIAEMENNLFSISLLKNIDDFLGGLQRLGLQMNLWKAQNTLFRIKNDHTQIHEDMPSDIPDKGRWRKFIENIGLKLQVRM
jgi:alpha-amylase/alpha-mannosidase (GH57 family)